MDSVPAHADEGDVDVKMALLSLMTASLVFADGGTIVLHKAAGEFEVTLFSKAEVVRAGDNDLSVMVQRKDNSTVMDATVLLHMEREQNTGEITRLTGIATHAKATNKTLYASSVNIPSTGMWKLTVDVSSGGQSSAVSTEVNVLAPLPPMQNYWPFVAMVPLLGIAFVVNRKLRAKFRAKRV